MKTMLEAVDKVIVERVRQNEKWGYPQKNSPFEWVSILTEEVGELAQATNDAFMGQIKSNQTDKIVHEAIQIAAVAVAIIEHLSKETL